jgi:hypothetical protein
LFYQEGMAEDEAEIKRFERALARKSGQVEQLLF